MTKKINKESSLAEILKKPGMAEILAKNNLPCLYCPMARYEIEKLKLGDICQAYHLDLKKILKELNEKLSQDKQK